MKLWGKNTTVTEENQWYAISCQILGNCRPIADRVLAEGVKLMLTDTDWETLRGFEIVLKRATDAEMLSICVAAGINSKQFNAIVDLYNYRKHR